MTVAELIEKLKDMPANARLDSYSISGKIVVFAEGRKLDPLFQIMDPTLTGPAELAGTTVPSPR